MSIAHELKQEHEHIERELLELETVMYTSIINYPNLIHVLKGLKEFWEKHEKKEESFFMDLHNKGFTIPVKKLSFEHGKMKNYMSLLIDTFKKGNEEEMHTVLDKYGKELIDKLRIHMADEDWILYALPRRL